ncbi:MAG: DUF6159 family protein [Methanoregula sp.]
MTVRISEVIRGWLGWCPNAGTLNPRPAIISTPPVTISPTQQDGGAGGSGRIDRGFRLAVGSIRLLFGNKRLFWFSLMTGLVMLFSIATNLLIQLYSGTNPFSGTGLVTVPKTILVVQGSIPWFVLTFTLALVTMLLTVYLLGGLVTCVSYFISGKTITPWEGLSRAGDHILPLAGWAVIGALAGIALTYITNSYTASIPIILLSTAATIVFGILTMFVVPAIVLNDEGLIPALRTSFSMVRKLWGEVIVCAGIFFLIVFGIMLLAMVPISIIGFSSGNPGMVGVAVVLYMLVMLVILFIGSTIVGIATLGLYTYGKTGTISPVFEGKTVDGALA